jgi:hypothetical protein
MQDHVHRSDPQHGWIEVEAVERLLVEMLAQGGVAENFWMFLAQELAATNEETAGAGGRVADDVPRRRLDKLDHQFDDVAGRSELPVLTGRGDLSEHIFVDVALGVAIVHLHLVEFIDDLGEERRVRNSVAGLLHVLGEIALGRDLFADEGENVLVDDFEHLLRLEQFEPRPTKVFVGTTALLAHFFVAAPIPPFRKNAPLQRYLERGGFRLLERLQLVETLDKEQVGDLLHYAHRVRQAARPEVVPDGVDLIFDLAHDHDVSTLPC